MDNDKNPIVAAEEAELDAAIDEALRLIRGLLVTAVICGAATAGSAVAIAIAEWTKR